MCKREKGNVIKEREQDYLSLRVKGLPLDWQTEVTHRKSAIYKGGNPVFGWAV